MENRRCRQGQGNLTRGERRPAMTTFSRTFTETYGQAAGQPLGNGFSREHIGIPTTDPVRMARFFENELRFRGKTPQDFANEPPTPAYFYALDSYKPTACMNGAGVKADGTIVWNGPPLALYSSPGRGVAEPGGAAQSRSTEGDALALGCSSYRSTGRARDRALWHVACGHQTGIPEHRPAGRATGGTKLLFVRAGRHPGPRRALPVYVYRVVSTEPAQRSERPD